MKNRNRTETELCLYRTRTEHETNFLKYSESEQNRTEPSLISEKENIKRWTLRMHKTHAYVTLLLYSGELKLLVYYKSNMLLPILIVKKRFSK